MTMKEYLKRSNLIFTEVKVNFTSFGYEHRFELINNDQISIKWYDDDINDYPRIKEITKLKDNDIYIDIHIKNIPGVMNSIITLLEKYLHGRKRHIKFDTDRNIILTIKGFNISNNEEKAILQDLQYHQLSEIAGRLKSYLIKNNFYTNEILNSSYREPSFDTFSMYLKNDGYIVDNENTDKLNKLLNDIEEITPFFTLENTVTQIKDHIFIKFHLDSSLDLEDFEYPLLSDLFIMNELKKSRYERIPLFRFNETVVHDTTGFNLDVYEIPINNEYLSICSNISIRVNKDDENVFSFIPYEFKPLLKDYLKRIKEYLKYSDKISQVGMTYDADVDSVYLYITASSDFEVLKKEVN